MLLLNKPQSFLTHSRIVYAAPHSARRDVYVSSWDQMWRWAVQHLYNHAEPTSATWWLTFGKTHARCQKRHLESTLKIQGTKEIAQHTQMHHRAEIHTCCHIYICFTVDFLLNFLPHKLTGLTKQTNAASGLSAWHVQEACVFLSPGWKRGQGLLQWLRCANCQKC